MKIIFLRSQLELDNVVHDNNMYVYLYATTNEQLMMAVVNIKQLFFFYPIALSLAALVIQISLTANQQSFMFDSIDSV